MYLLYIFLSIRPDQDRGRKNGDTAGFDPAHIGAAIFPIQPPRQAHWNRSKKMFLLNALGNRDQFRQGPSSQKT
jgi:hypothetical protein